MSGEEREGVGLTAVLPGLEGYAGRDVALGQWDTDPVLARALVRWAGVGRGSLVVEPSCGIGNVALAARVAGAEVVGVEIDPARAAVARSRGVRVIVGDAMGIALDEAVLASLNHTVVAVGNPPFEHDGALRHPLRWLDLAERACWIAPLETLAGRGRAELWRKLGPVRVDVCVPRPPFGEGQSGMSEIALFEAIPRGAWEAAGGGTSLGWVDWRALGAPSP